MITLYGISIILTICVGILHFLLIRDTRLVNYHKVTRIKLNLVTVLGYLLVVSFCSLIPFIGFAFAILCFFGNIYYITDEYYNTEVIFPKWVVKTNKILFESIW